MTVSNPFGSFADPAFPHSTIPTMPLLGLSDSERALIETLRNQAYRLRADMLLTESYYLGVQVIQNLRIAIPKELEFLRTLVGWPAMAVDPYVERLRADSFRVPDATEGDDYLADIFADNDFASEQSLAFTDALSMGRSYWMVGSPLETGGAPQVTVESPLNMGVLWDLRGTTPRAAMQEYWSSDGRRRGALLVPNQTVHLAENDKGEWEVFDRDEHGFDFVPVVRMAHRPRTNNRDGRSAISPALRSYTDAACRTLLGLEVARELYSVPQRIILGATEADFQKSDGTAKSAWDTYITRVLALERDDEGNLPELKQMTPYDPSVFTKLLDWFASAAAGEVAATPQDMGLYTQGNPASADAVVAGESRRDRRGIKMQHQFGTPLIRVAQYAARFDNRGVLPDKYRRLECDWDSVSMATPGVTADAVTKEIAAGSVPPTSDVVLKKLGYSRVERARLAQDREADGAQSLLAEIASNLQVKQAREDKVAIKDAAPAASMPDSAPIKPPAPSK